MDYFVYRNGTACAEGVPLPLLAERFGTPLYVYSRATLARHCKSLKEAFGDYPLLPCFAVKANGNLSVLREIFSHGFGADVVSVGELERALAAGAPPDRVVFSGVGKLDSEIARGLEAGIFSFNVESGDELRRIAAIAAKAGKIARVSLRINPHIDAKTIPHIATGLYDTKFGVAEAEAAELFTWLETQTAVKLIGIACHIGSQITETEPFREAGRRMATLAMELKGRGFPLEMVDLGGGLGIRYHGEEPPSPVTYAEAILESVRPTGLKLVIEPGRSIVGNAGVLVSRVVGVKQMPEKHFVIVDAAMNDLIRPSLYEAYHEILPVAESPAARTSDVVGPVCESGDYLGKDRRLPEVKAGDLLYIRGAGAYGSSMASNYNARPRAAEVLVDGDAFRLVRRREKLEDLWRDEI